MVLFNRRGRGSQNRVWVLGIVMRFVSFRRKKFRCLMFLVRVLWFSLKMFHVRSSEVFLSILLETTKLIISQKGKCYAGYNHNCDDNASVGWTSFPSSVRINVKKKYNNLYIIIRLNYNNNYITLNMRGEPFVYIPGVAVHSFCSFHIHRVW